MKLGESAIINSKGHIVFCYKLQVLLQVLQSSTGNGQKTSESSIMLELLFEVKLEADHNGMETL